MFNTPFKLDSKAYSSLLLTNKIPLFQYQLNKSQINYFFDCQSGEKQPLLISENNNNVNKTKNQTRPFFLPIFHAMKIFCKNMIKTSNLLPSNVVGGNYHRDNTNDCEQIRQTINQLKHKHQQQEKEESKNMKELTEISYSMLNFSCNTVSVCDNMETDEDDNNNQSDVEVEEVKEIVVMDSKDDYHRDDEIKQNNEKNKQMMTKQKIQIPHDHDDDDDEPLIKSKKRKNRSKKKRNDCTTVTTATTITAPSSSSSPIRTTTPIVVTSNHQRKNNKTKRSKGKQQKHQHQQGKQQSQQLLTNGGGGSVGVGGHHNNNNISVTTYYNCCGLTNDNTNGIVCIDCNPSVVGVGVRGGGGGGRTKNKSKSTKNKRVQPSLTSQSQPPLQPPMRSRMRQISECSDDSLIICFSDTIDDTSISWCGSGNTTTTSQSQQTRRKFYVDSESESDSGLCFDDLELTKKKVRFNYPSIPLVLSPFFDIPTLIGIPNIIFMMNLHSEQFCNLQILYPH